MNLTPIDDNRGANPGERAASRIMRARWSNSDKVDLSNLGLTLWPESLKDVLGLRELNLSNNKLTHLPTWIGELAEMRIFNLEGNQMKSLAGIHGLRKVEELNVSVNRLSYLPPEIGDLTFLRSFQFFSNSIRTLPPEIGRLRNLQNLNAFNNVLEQLPPEIGDLQALTFLNLQGNQLTSLPSEIGRLKLLPELYLFNNRLVELPSAIGQLRSLEELYLFDNQLAALPEDVLKLKKLRILLLHGNPRLGLPPGVLGPTWEQISGKRKSKPKAPTEILDYYFSTRGDKGRSLLEVKLVFVGRGEVGKSSLVDVLRGKKFLKNRKRTDGIAITPWEVKLPDEPATILMWDFGGQEIMHGTHQFFLTHRSLYVVMVDGRHDRAKQDAEYWLKLVRAFGGDSPVLVVMNRQKENPFDIDRQYLSDKYEVKLEHFFRTECSQKDKVKPVRRAVLREAARMLATEDRFPAKSWNIKARLADMKARGEDYFSDEDYNRICVAFGISEVNEQQKLLKRLADLGTVVSFPDDVKLAELSVLNPEWATDGIYRVVTNEPLRELRHGQLKLSTLRSVLPKERWPKPKHLQYLVELMKKFELCFRMEDEPNTVLVPELLPDETPPLRDWDPAKCAMFVYRYAVLPHGVLPRFVTRTHVLSRGRERWRSGVVLADDGAEALIKADFDANTITILIRGGYADARRALLKVVRHHFDVIHGRIKDLDPEERVAMPGFPDVTVSFRDLLLDERDGRTKTRVTVNGVRHTVAIGDLLNGFEAPNERRKAQSQTVRDLGLQLHFGEGSKAQFGRDYMETHNKQEISGGTFNAPVGVNQHSQIALTICSESRMARSATL